MFHPDFCNDSATYFEISVKSAHNPGILVHSASTLRFTAIKGELEKDAKHNDLVGDAGGKFCHL